MYSPNPTAISDKAQELLEDWLNEDDKFGDAVMSSLNLLHKLLDAPLEELPDVRLDLQKTLERYAKSKANFMQDAEDALVAEVGYVKRVDVDQFEFVNHETRY
jgi:hypothetical protein